jgi:transcriptional regulator with XRE-family HTH domain
MRENPPRQTPMRRKLIGRRLRMRRIQAGVAMRHPEIIDILGSTRTLQRLENGESTRLKYPAIGALCDLYKVPAEEKFELQRLWRLGPDANWTQPRGRSIFGFDAYRELARQASAVYQYESTFVPGPLQTERTMRMLFSRNPALSAEDIDQGARSRLRGQRSFWRSDGDCEFNFLLSEAVLRSGCDAAQLDRLREADSLDYATVRYLPFERAGVVAVHPVPTALLPVCRRPRHRLRRRPRRLPILRGARVRAALPHEPRFSGRPGKVN